MNEPRGPSPTGILATVGVLAAAVLCCAGPALLAGGALSGLGGLLRSPWLIIAGVMLIAGALAYTLARHTSRRGQPRADTPSRRPPTGVTPMPRKRPDRVEKRTR